jgi:hypothetical protein
MTGITRRNLFGMGIGAAATASLAPLAFVKPAHASPIASSFGNPLVQDAKTYASSVAKAIDFLNFMMDAYATGNTTRLVQSYSDQNGLESTAFTYDNAVSIHAYLLQGGKDSIDRAEIIGNGLLYAQATNFPFNDGRFAQAYFVNTEATDGSGAFITPAAFPFYFYTSAVGDQAWAGMALSQLYRRTGLRKYLAAAVKVANWIVANTYSTIGPGGYSFGTAIDQYNNSVPSTNGKSTEHNIDTFAFFTMLDELTHHGKASNGQSWTSLAQHALTFVIAMYNQSGGYFYTGTLSDQATINPTPIPEDCQTWSYLSLLDNRYKGTIDWAIANLQTTDTPASRASQLTGNEKITGMVFDSASLSTTTPSDDPNAVWLEGTAHTVAALVARALAGRDSLPRLFDDLGTALKFVNQLQTAQAELASDKRLAARPYQPAQGFWPRPR